MCGEFAVLLALPLCRVLVLAMRACLPPRSHLQQRHTAKHLKIATFGRRLLCLWDGTSTDRPRTRTRTRCVTLPPPLGGGGGGEDSGRTWALHAFKTIHRAIGPGDGNDPRNPNFTLLGPGSVNFGPKMGQTTISNISNISKSSNAQHKTTENKTTHKQNNKTKTNINNNRKS